MLVSGYQSHYSLHVVTYLNYAKTKQSFVENAPKICVGFLRMISKQLNVIG
jgi:hypothetical protein